MIRPLAHLSRARWPQTRRMGMIAFVVRDGMLMGGLAMAALWLAGMALLVDDFDIAQAIGPALRTFALGGLAWGLLLWSLLELRHRR